MNDVAADVGQPEVAALEAVRELQVIEPELMQHRGVQVVDVDTIFRGVPADFVGRSVDLTAFECRRRPSTC